MSTQPSFVWRGLRGLVSSEWLRLILFKILCLALVVGGVAVAWFSLSGAFARLVVYLPDNTGLRIAVAVVVALAGLIGLLPVAKNAQKGRAITYNGKRGPVTINLDSIEGALARSAAKLPEIKKVLSMRVLPADGQKVTIQAELIPSKEPSVNMRQFGYAVSDELAQMAEQILGENEVAKVDVRFPRLGDELTAGLVSHVALTPASKPAETAQYEQDEEELVEEETEEAVFEEKQETQPKRVEDNDLLLGAGIPSGESADAGDDWGTTQPALNVDIDDLASEQKPAVDEDPEEPRTDPTGAEDDSDEEPPAPDAESAPSLAEDEPKESDDTFR